ncbi:MAG TPA: hypothetical protein VF104_00910, partial [Burkholderiales bacterium]
DPADVALAQATFAELLPRLGEGRRVRLRVRAADGATREMDVLARNLFDVPAIGGLLVSARALADREAR